ncbi:hypothetical protein G6F35_014200 [Rhizopus arrhizus]|nr:hypothetical protein G6F35_014200 [Rhizopus arrhizus]
MISTEVHQLHQQLEHAQGHHADDGDGVGQRAVHHQAERAEGCRGRRRDRRGRVRPQRSATSDGSHKIDEGEDADPDDVQEVPEQAQARQATLVDRVQAMAADHVQEDDDPDQAEGDVQAVRTDQREERGQVSAAAGAGAFRDQVMEFPDFHRDEACAEQERHHQPAHGAGLVVGVHVQVGHPEGEAREQQQQRFDQDELQVEQFLARGAARGGTQKPKTVLDPSS